MGKIDKAFSGVGRRIPKTPVGAAGYDNARENIDPHLKTKVLNTSEILAKEIVTKDIIADNIYVNASVDHKISSDDDDLVIENFNEDKDIVFCVNDGGVDRCFLRIDSSEPRLVVDTESSTTVGINGLFRITGPINTSIFGSGFGMDPTVSGAGFVAVNASPTMNNSGTAQAFRLTPSSGNNDRTVIMNYFQGDTHLANYDDDFTILEEDNNTRVFFALSSADNSNVNYKWIKLGGLLTIGDFGYNNAVINEDMITLTGGLSRPFGSNGTVKQRGLRFKGFGSSGNLSGTDECFALAADGGRFNFGFDYNADNNGVYFGAGSDMGVGYNGTKGFIETDLINASDLVIACGTDKTLELEESVWDDYNSGGFPSSASNREEFKDLNGNNTGVETYVLDEGDTVHGSFELEHSYKEGTDIYFHVHFQGQDGISGASDNVKFELTYSIGKMGEAPAAAITIDVTKNITDDYHFYVAEFPGIIGTDIDIGDQFFFKLERVAPSSNSYGGKVLLATVGLHVEIDTLGSRQRFIK